MSERGLQTFEFQLRRDHVNWRRLALIDVDQIKRTKDIDQLDENLVNVTFCDIDNEDLRGVDYNFIKLFKLAQLMLEYVLYTQSQLVQSKNTMELNVVEKNKEIDSLQRKYGDAKKESKRRKSMIASYQRLVDANNLNQNKCNYCSKSFITPSYLLAHCERRHPEHAPFDINISYPGKGESKDPIIDRALKDLQQELRNVRGDIGLLSKFRGQENTQPREHTAHEALLRAEIEKRDETIAKFKLELAQVEERHRNEREISQQRHEHELTAARSLAEQYLQALRAAEVSASASEAKVSLLEQQAQQSNLGSLVDDPEDIDKRAQFQERESEALKEQMRMQENMYEKQLANLEQKYKDLQALQQNLIKESNATRALREEMPPPPKLENNKPREKESDSTSNNASIQTISRATTPKRTPNLRAHLGEIPSTPKHVYEHKAGHLTYRTKTYFKLHPKDFIQERRNAQTILERKLANVGLGSDTQRISTEELNENLNALKRARDLKDDGDIYTASYVSATEQLDNIVKNYYVPVQTTNNTIYGKRKWQPPQNSTLGQRSVTASEVSAAQLEKASVSNERPAQQNSDVVIAAAPEVPKLSRSSGTDTKSGRDISTPNITVTTESPTKKPIRTEVAAAKTQAKALAAEFEQQTERNKMATEDLKALSIDSISVTEDSDSSVPDDTKDNPRQSVLSRSQEVLPPSAQRSAALTATNPVRIRIPPPPPPRDDLEDEAGPAIMNLSDPDSATSSSEDETKQNMDEVEQSKVQPESYEQETIPQPMDNMQSFTDSSDDLNLSDSSSG
eukprot:m.87943 g.87943  ORF g.87943 m.87943 type:complete len:796 (+) comp13133_c0_seq6:195-2582(+)